MLYPVAIEFGDDQTAFGVVVPDLTGCCSAGDTYLEALDNVREAIQGYLKELSADGVRPPVAHSVEHWYRHPDFDGWAWSLVATNTRPY